jgi:hypothetical protein
MPLLFSIFTCASADFYLDNKGKHYKKTRGGPLVRKGRWEEFKGDL